MDPISSKHHEFHEDRTLILPGEILVNVFKFLDQPKDITQVLAVNRRWRAMGLSPMNKVLDAKIKEIGLCSCLLAELENKVHPIFAKRFPAHPELFAKFPVTDFAAKAPDFHSISDPKAKVQAKMKYAAAGAKSLKKSEQEARKQNEIMQRVLKAIDQPRPPSVGKSDSMLLKTGRFFNQSFHAVKSFFLRSCKFFYHFLLSFFAWVFRR